MWTQFWDMHSGGGQKLNWLRIYIEAPREEAELIFQSRFGRNPNRVTCTCCGPDYSIIEGETLEQLSAYHRGCAYAYFRPDGTECSEDEAWKSGKGTTPGYTSRYVERSSGRSYDTYRTPDEYIASGEVCVVRAEDIKPKERKGSLRSEGYMWAD